MQDQQVGDAPVLVEGQAEGWFRLAGRLSVAIHTVGMPVNTVNMAINSVSMPINTIRDSLSCKDK